MELYFIHSDDKLFATHTGIKSVVIAAKTKEKMVELKRALKKNHKKSGGVMNRCAKMYPFVDDNVDILKLDKNNINPKLSSEIMKNLRICSLSFETNHGRMLCDQMQQLSNSDMFIVNEFEYSEKLETLSLRGKYNSERYYPFEYDFVEYLNHVYDNTVVD